MKSIEAKELKTSIEVKALQKGDAPSSSIISEQQSFSSGPITRRRSSKKRYNTNRSISQRNAEEACENDTEYKNSVEANEARPFLEEIGLTKSEKGEVIENLSKGENQEQKGAEKNRCSTIKAQAEEKRILSDVKMGKEETKTIETEKESQHIYRNIIEKLNELPMVNP